MRKVINMPTRLMNVTVAFVIIILSISGLAALRPRSTTSAHQAHSIVRLSLPASGTDGPPAAPGTRDFAWNLFGAFLNDGKGDPDWGNWADWNTREDLCLVQPHCKADHHKTGYQLSDLVQEHFEYPDQLVSQIAVFSNVIGPGNTIDAPYATVIYNAKASQIIRTRALNKEKTLKGLVRSDGASMDGLEDGSIIIKAVWELVPQNSPATRPEYANIWDPSISNQYVHSDDKSVGFPAQWTHTVVPIDESKTDSCELEEVGVVPPAGAGSPQTPVKNVPLGCFDNITVTTTNKDEIGELTPRKYPNVGDHVVLVGMHIIKKVSGNWVWSTFWWTNRPNYTTSTSTNYSAGRPSNISSRWNHYVMTTMTSCAGAASPCPASAFNPYIEGPDPNTLSLNCITCHSKAVFPHKAVGISLGAPDANGNFPNHASSSDSDNYFKYAVKTDYLWSLVSKYRAH